MFYYQNSLFFRKIIVMGKKQKNKEKNTVKQVKDNVTEKINKKDSQQQMPEQQMPEQHMPEQHMPEQQMPGQQMLGQLLPGQQLQGQTDNKKRKFLKRIIKFIFVTFFVGVVILGFLQGFFEEIGANSAIKFRKFLELPERMDDLEDKVGGIDEIVTKDHESILIMTSKKDSAKNTDAEPDKVVFLSDGNTIETYIVTLDVLAARPQLDNVQKKLGINSDGISEDIIECQNTPLIIPYTDDDSEIFFSGQYNENNQWEGKCIFNIYKESRLSYIFEGIYDDGSLFSYKSIFIDSDGNWRVNDRVCGEKFNSGETWTYRKSNDYDKPFLTENVTSEDILSVESFLDIMDEDIVSYYCGNTSSGLYNDENKNGKTYYVGYFLPEEYNGSGDEPVIKTLYNGKFEGGKFKDDEYKSWYITRDTNTKYMYFKGCFADNTTDPNDSSKEQKENPLSLSRINELIEENHFTEEYRGEFFVDYEIE